MNARGTAALERAAAEIRDAHGVKVSIVAADITDAGGRSEVLAAARDVDILVTNAGGPPPGMWSDWERDDFIAALDANMLTPIAVLGLSNSARAGLTGYVAGTSRQVAAHGVTINNLLPGIHATDRADALDRGVAEAEGIGLDEARARRAATIPARRYGSPEEFGKACAFLCSQHAGFIVGQNILLDGGAVNATL